MPINFSELVNTVQQRNKQNREELSAQIMPFLDVAVRKSLYEQEKHKAASEAAEVNKQVGTYYGVDYQAPTLESGKLASPESQQAILNAQITAQAPVMQMEAFANVYGTKLPDNYKRLKPEEAKLRYDEMVKEHSMNEAIDQMFTMYPDLSAAVQQDPKWETYDTKIKFAKMNQAISSMEDSAKRAQDFNDFIRKEQVKTDEKIRTYHNTVATRQTGSTRQPTQSQTKAENTVKAFRSKQGKTVGRFNVAMTDVSGGAEARAKIDGWLYRMSADGTLQVAVNEGGKTRWVTAKRSDDGKIYKFPYRGFTTKNPPKLRKEDVDSMMNAKNEYSRALTFLAMEEEEYATNPPAQQVPAGEYDWIFGEE